MQWDLHGKYESGEILERIRVQWLTHLIPALKKLRQKVLCNFKTQLVYIASSKLYMAK